MDVPVDERLFARPRLFCEVGMLGESGAASLHANVASLTSIICNHVRSLSYSPSIEFGSVYEYMLYAADIRVQRKLHGSLAC
jgi:hypothetical protein